MNRTFTVGDRVRPTGEIECDSECGTITRITSESYGDGTTEITYWITWDGASAPDPHGPQSFEAAR